MPYRVSGCFHAKPLRMARSAISRPHLRVLETRALLVCHRRIGKSSRSAIQGHGDGLATVHTLPRLHHLLPCSAPLNGRSASCGGDLPNKERTPLPRTGWSVGHSIAGVAPAGISRRMFRCLWHTSRGSRFVMSKMGNEFPHSSSRRRNIAYSMAASVDIRKEGANLCEVLLLRL
jgi:hypothetical protein